MKKTNTSMKSLILAAAFAGIALSASAQMATNTPAPGDLSTATGTGYGLLGADYAGAEFGYIHHIDGPPRVMHRYGFVANRPVTPLSSSVNVDAMFKYNYTTGSDSGIHAWQHDAMIGSTAYLNLARIKPFVEGNVGWAWTAGNVASKNDSFAYLVGGGAEVQVAERFVITPYANFREATHFHSHGWTYGTKAAYRLTRQWSGLVGGELDENHNVEWRVGMNRHF